MARRFWAGFQFVIRGFQIFRSSRKLQLLAVVPLLIDAALFIWTITWIGPAISGFVATALGYLFTSADGFWYGLLYYPALVLFWLVFMVCLSLAAYLLASLISAPFNGLMAEEYLEKRGVLPDRPFSFGRFFKTSIRMLAISFLRAFFLLGLGVLLFLISFFPGLNLVSSYAAFVLMAFDASDYAMESLELSFFERLRFLRRNSAEYLGMGAFVGCMIFIPGLSILLMPLSVLGASDMVANRHMQEKVKI